MKRFFLIFCLCAALAAAVTPTGGAAVLTPPAVSAAQTAQTADDILYRFSVSAPEAAAYEAYRRENYEIISQTYTDAQIAASRESWLLDPAFVLCEVLRGPDGDCAPVCAFAPEQNGQVEISLIKDILPALAAAGTYTEEAFSFSLAFSAAVRINGEYHPLSDRAEPQTFTCPATVQIHYVLPAGTDNSLNPAFLFAPMTAPLTLQYPALRGHVFTGWQTESGVYVDAVQPGAVGTPLYARFSPCVYRINYVLTTRPGYSFNRVSNTDNPKTFTYGEETPLYAVKAPIGYTFGGWYADAAFSGKAVWAIAPDTLGDVILYARWLTEDEAEEEAARAAGWGDLNGDGDITAADARLALRAAVELETLPPAVVAKADFAKLGRLTATNARVLLRVAVGLDRMTDVLKQHGLM